MSPPIRGTKIKASARLASGGSSLCGRAGLAAERMYTHLRPCGRMAAAIEKGSVVYTHFLRLCTWSRPCGTRNTAIENEVVVYN